MVCILETFTDNLSSVRVKWHVPIKLKVKILNISLIRVLKNKSLTGRLTNN